MPLNSDNTSDSSEPDAPEPAAHEPGADAHDPIGEFWDQRYAGLETLWSGQPNAALVSEARALVPGRALDVGCGEGADALWLAAQGWDVTALDVSRVALDRAARAELALASEPETAGGAAGHGVKPVRWLHAALVEAALPPATFDLVSAQYPALLRTPDNVAEHALLDAVAPGGVLLIVHHPAPTAEEATRHGFDADLYVSPANVRALLGDAWLIEVDETRPRHVAAGAGAHHTEDVVVRARRVR